MGAILVIVLLVLLLTGDRWKMPRLKRRSKPGRSAPKVVDATSDSESMERYYTAAVSAGVIDKSRYRAQIEALAATTHL